MIKHGDSQPINVINKPNAVVKKGSADMEQQILKFQDQKDEERKKQTKTER